MSIVEISPGRSLFSFAKKKHGMHAERQGAGGAAHVVAVIAFDQDGLID